MQSKINKLFTKPEEALLKALIGQKLIKIRHDRFDFTSVSFLRVTFFFEDGGIYELENSTEPTDFMWDDYGEEDVAVFKFHKTEDKGINYNYGFDNYPAQIETLINETIKDIVVIEDNVNAYNSKTKEFVSGYDYVKGVIFTFDGYKYCFHRGPWFSDDIVIIRGETPETKIGNINDDWEWGEERYSINTRKFRSLK